MKFIENFGVKGTALLSSVASVAILTGCGTPNYHYSAYIGQQQNWTTSPGSFVKTVDGVPLYSQYPSQPYELVGAVIVNNERALAKAVKYYKADAAMIYRRSVGPSGSAVAVGGPGVWMDYPVMETRITAQLIRFKR